MTPIDPKTFAENPISLIGDGWMLVTAGTPDHFNTMTASWGGMGFLWGKPVAFVFVRTSRFTYEFTEKNDLLTLSFFEMEKYRKALQICGSHSGRNCDKMALTGLTPEETENGSTTFAEARLVIEGRKLYADMIEKERFIEPKPLQEWYANNDFHKMYIVEIANIRSRP